jgi:hypothetical protein
MVIIIFFSIDASSGEYELSHLVTAAEAAGERPTVEGERPLGAVWFSLLHGVFLLSEGVRML